MKRGFYYLSTLLLISACATQPGMGIFPSVSSTDDDDNKMEAAAAAAGRSAATEALTPAAQTDEATIVLTGKDLEPVSEVSKAGPDAADASQKARIAKVEPASVDGDGQQLKFLGSATAMQEGNTIAVTGLMSKNATEPQLLRYTECVAATNAHQKGFSYLNRAVYQFKREENANRASALYVMARDYPDGNNVSEIDIVLNDCEADGIPLK